jgi:hypothetical protein
MGIDRWCSRAWDGRLCLLVALAATPGCLPDPDLSVGTRSSAMAPVPDAPMPNAPVPDAPASEAFVPEAFVPDALVGQFPQDAPQQPLCGDALLGGDFSLDDSALPTLYVDATTDAAAPDGSLAAPFRTLGEALLAGGDAAAGSAQALEPTRRVLVASGYYDENVAVPAGTLLLGGYDAESWEQGLGPSIISGSVYLGTATVLAGILSPEGYLIEDVAATTTPSAAPLTALRHFDVNGGVEVVPGARALLRDNVIAPVFYQTIGDPPGMRRALAVWVKGATVRADENHLVVPADDPASVDSGGFFTWNSCAWVTKNDITDYRSPVYLYGGLGVAATFNVIRRGENGVGAGANQALIAANSIQTYMPLSGCVYAITMEANAHPDIRDNTIYLADAGNRGILEEDGASRPTALLGNRFYSPRSGAALYIDHRGAVDPELITDVATLNALSGVPAIGGNTLTRVGAAP